MCIIMLEFYIYTEEISDPEYWIIRLGLLSGQEFLTD